MQLPFQETDESYPTLRGPTPFGVSGEGPTLLRGDGRAGDECKDSVFPGEQTTPALRAARAAIKAAPPNSLDPARRKGDHWTVYQNEQGVIFLIFEGQMDRGH